MNYPLTMLSSYGRHLYNKLFLTDLKKVVYVKPHYFNYGSFRQKWISNNRVRFYDALVYDRPNINEFCSRNSVHWYYFRRPS